MRLGVCNNSGTKSSILSGAEKSNFEPQTRESEVPFSHAFRNLKLLNITVKVRREKSKNE